MGDSAEFPEFPESMPEWLASRDIGAAESSDAPVSLDDLGGLAQLVTSLAPSFDVPSEAQALDDLREQRSSDYYYFRHGVLAYFRTDYDAAAESLSLIGEPTAFIMYLLADAHDKSGNYPAALDGYNFVLAKEAKNTSVLLAKSGIMRKLGRFDEEVCILTQILDINPYFTPAWNNRGFACLRSKDYEQAQGDFHRALALSVDYIDARLGQGRAHLGLGCHEEAKEDFDIYLAVRGNDPVGWYHRSKACVGLGCYEEALSNVNHARRLNPQDADYPLLAGDIHSDRGQWQDAIHAYRDAAELVNGKKKAEALEKLAKALLSAERHDEAYALATRLISENHNTAALLVRGEASFRMGNCSAAEADCTEILHAEPRNMAALILMEQICGRLGKGRGAQRYFRAAAEEFTD